MWSASKNTEELIIDQIFFFICLLFFIFILY